MDHDANSAHSPEDSITAGREIAEKLGLFEENQAIRIASLGTDDAGTEQLLLIDNQTLRVCTLEGPELLEVHRDSIVTIEVEDIAPAPSQRLLLTVRNGVFGKAEEWAHRTDHNGRYLKDTLIQMTPFPPTGSHNQAIPRSDWRYDEIALMVGKIVMRAAEAESTLSTVAFWADGFEPKAFGQSGEQLTKHLDERASEITPPERPATGPEWNEAARHGATSQPSVEINHFTETDENTVSVFATWEWITESGETLPTDDEQRIYYFAFNDQGEIHDYTYETIRQRQTAENEN